MNQLAMTSAETLPALVQRAASQLASAATAAEVLDARDFAGIVYDAAKRAARLLKAKQAHDELVVKASYAQADALEIECMAKRRLADEYDAAQDRGEVAIQGQHGSHVPDGNMTATAADIGLTRKEVHDARLIRDAEVVDPGIIRRVLDDRLAAGDAPTRAALRRNIIGTPPRKYTVSDDSLWLWGRLRDFERDGYFKADSRTLWEGMTEPMRADIKPLIRPMIEFLTRLEAAHVA